jgi:hypothetical protein
VHVAAAGRHIQVTHHNHLGACACVGAQRPSSCGVQQLQHRRVRARTPRTAPCAPACPTPAARTPCAAALPGRRAWRAGGAARGARRRLAHTR